MTGWLNDLRALLHDLEEWLLAFAESEWAIGVLALASFSEAIFFPVPPDPLLLGIAVVQRPLALWLAILVTLTSVAGALVGHWLGRRLGRPILNRLFSERAIEVAETWLSRYGAWATAIAAFTPIPYKVFAITAGVLDLDRRTFVIASLIGRGARFLALGALAMLFGEEIRTFIDDNFGTLTIAAGIAVVLLLVAWQLFRRRAKSREVEEPSHDS